MNFFRLSLYCGVAFLAGMCFHIHSVAGNDGVLNVMKMKALEQGVQTPVELFWKDLWEIIFHRQGNKFWKSIGFKAGRLGRYKMCRSVAAVIMYELRRELFSKGEAHNERAWKKIEVAFEKLLREWFDQNPLDPYSSLEIGVWKCLVKLYAEWLEPNLRGSKKLKILQGIILDPELSTIREWTDRKHIDIIRGGGSRNAKLDAVSKLAKKHRSQEPESLGDISKTSTVAE